MEGFFSEENKELWGFSLYKDGQYNKKVKKYGMEVVKKIVNEAYHQNWEMHFLPSIPCIFIKTSREIWHYLKSKDEAEKFLSNIVFSRHYPCCSIY